MYPETVYDPLQIDRYGCLFMYATHRDLTTAPRHIIRMKEPVNPDALLQAVKKAVQRFPQMALGLVRGPYRYAYRKLEKPPVVLPFYDISPYYIGSDDTNGYLFLCGYRGNTIYLEYQHCTSDGRGFDQFIRCVLFYYLQACGVPVENDGSIRTLDSPFDPVEGEDGYRLLESLPQSNEAHLPDVPAFHLTGFDNNPDGNELTTEITLSLPQVKAFVKTHSLSPVVFLMTAISFGLQRTYRQVDEQQNAIVAEIPMDLRGIAPTKTVRFFLSLLDMRFPYSAFSMSFLDACRCCRDFFDTQRAPEHAIYWALKNATRVYTAHQSEQPIDEKEVSMREQARAYIRRDSFILTNVGPFTPTPSMQTHIMDYSAILPCAHQPLGILVSAYRDSLKISLSQRDFNHELVKQISHVLRENGFANSCMSYTFHPTRYDGQRLAKG